MTFTTSGSWEDVLDRLRQGLRPNDLVVVLGARPGALAWDPTLDRLPGILASLVPESFLIVYPSEAALEVLTGAASLTEQP